jgi:hypothetical protein
MLWKVLKNQEKSWRMPIRIHKEYYLNSVSPIYINPVGDGF